MEREFLGIGWKYPVNVEADGNISSTSQMKLSIKAQDIEIEAG